MMDYIPVCFPLKWQYVAQALRRSSASSECSSEQKYVETGLAEHWHLSSWQEPPEWPATWQYRLQGSLTKEERKGTLANLHTTVFRFNRPPVSRYVMITTLLWIKEKYRDLQSRPKGLKSRMQLKRFLSFSTLESQLKKIYVNISLCTEGAAASSQPKNRVGIGIHTEKWMEHWYGSIQVTVYVRGLMHGQTRCYLVPICM